MGLDKPVPLQLADFLVNVARGDLGVDVWTNRGVSQVIGDSLPFTFALVAAGIGWAMLAGIPLGCYAAVHRNSWLDHLLGVISIGTIAVPPFVVALYTVLVFAVALRWFPSIGAGEPGDLGDQLYHLVLPAFSLGLGWVGYLARLVRASMLEVLGQAHIRTARAFGLPRRKIIFHYALKIAILPTVAVLGVGVGYLLSGAVFAEIVFSRPGLGKLIYDSVITRNYPVVMGTVLVTTGLFAAATLIADLLAAWLDPRIRYAL
jgi:peptide/nickel transport system permease protein